MVPHESRRDKIKKSLHEAVFLQLPMSSLSDEEQVDLDRRTDAVLAVLEAEATWEYGVGHRNSDGSYSADVDFGDDGTTEDVNEALEWAQDALDSGTYANAIVVRRPKNNWRPLSAKER